MGKYYLNTTFMQASQPDNCFNALFCDKYLIRFVYTEGVPDDE